MFNVFLFVVKLIVIVIKIKILRYIIKGFFCLDISFLKIIIFKIMDIMIFIILVCDEFLSSSYIESKFFILVSILYVIL